MMRTYCKICGYIRTQKSYSLRGQPIGICGKCRRRPQAEREALLHEIEMEKLLRQQHITNKNRARLGMLTKSGNQRTREIAAFITRIAAIAPRKRKRFEHLSTNDPDVLWEWKRLELPIPIEYLIELDAHLSMEDEYSLDADAIVEWESKDADGNYDDNNIIVKRGVAPPDYEGPCYTTDDGRELPF